MRGVVGRVEGGGMCRDGWVISDAKNKASAESSDASAKMHKWARDGRELTNSYSRADSLQHERGCRGMFGLDEA